MEKLKEVLMIKVLVMLFIALPMISAGQDSDDDSYIMYETVYLSPDGDNLDTFRENIAAHNKKYHNEEPYTAFVFSVANGPNAGQMIWMMGPATFSELDNRPSADGHDEDWDNNVVPYIDSNGTVEYWRRDDELSNIVEGGEYSMYYNRIWKVNNKYGFLVNGLLKQISETIKALEGENPWSVWDNQFRQGDLGRHIITSTPMKNWAELDESTGFQKTFKEVHGENSWIPFIRSMDLAFEDSYDEIWVVIPDLSGTSE